MAKILFITPLQRQRRIEVLMRRYGWTKYRLAKEMGVHAIALQRAFWRRKDLDNSYADVRLSTLKRVARALGVTVGFLTDKKET